MEALSRRWFALGSPMSVVFFFLGGSSYDTFTQEFVHILLQVLKSLLVSMQIWWIRAVGCCILCSPHSYPFLCHYSILQSASPCHLLLWIYVSPESGHLHHYFLICTTCVSFLTHTHHVFPELNGCGPLLAIITCSAGLGFYATCLFISDYLGLVLGFIQILHRKCKKKNWQNLCNDTKTKWAKRI